MTGSRLTILGGPNGAGKTTLARSTYVDLLEKRRFLNADDFAAELNPDDPNDGAFAAGRRLIRLRTEWIDQEIDFVVETTLATLTLLHAIPRAQNRGYKVSLVFLWVSDPDICIQRVANRVSEGGHFIPSDTVKRRYTLGLRYLPYYLEICDEVDLFVADGEPELRARRRSETWTIYGDLPPILSKALRR